MDVNVFTGVRESRSTAGRCTLNGFNKRTVLNTRFAALVSVGLNKCFAVPLFVLDKKTLFGNSRKLV